MRNRRTLKPTELLMLSVLRLNAPLSLQQMCEQTQGSTDTIRVHARELARKNLLVREYTGGLVYYSLPPAASTEVRQ